MTKLILSSLVLLSFTACKERHGPEPETSKFTENLFTGFQNNESQEEVSDVEKLSVETNNEESILVDIPVLEDNLLPLRVEEITTTPLGKTPEKKQSIQEAAISDGLDIRDIRVSQSPERTRIVFDSYTSTHTKAFASGTYNYNYLPQQHRITLTLNGYKHFTALRENKVRNFYGNSPIKKIYLTKTMDDSSFQCNIDLNQDAKVNVFDIKEPGRIVVDILTN